MTLCKLSAKAQKSHIGCIGMQGVGRDFDALFLHCIQLEGRKA